jgi:methyl-accepting chemotaxis protein
LGLAQDHADALSSLRGTLLQQPPAPKATSVSAGSVPDAGAALPSPLSGPLAEATVAIEQFVDESSRLRSELHSNEAAAGRILEGLESALPRAREAAYESEALSPHVASLFGLADRLNLLSVNLTGGASPDPESRGPLIEASREIRELSEEARALSRNLGTRLRQATAAAHRSKDAFSEIGETARGVHERAHRALRGGERLAQLGSRLEGAFSAIHDSAERAGRELEELSRSRGALEARIAVERGVAADRGSELASRAETIRLVLETIEKESAAADRLAAALGERRMTGTTPDRREA